MLILVMMIALISKYTARVLCHTRFGDGCEVGHSAVAESIGVSITVPASVTLLRIN